MHRRVRIALATASAAAVAVTGAVGLGACGTSESTAEAASAQTPAFAAQAGGLQGDPSALLAQALDPLVSDGTLTSGQGEAVVSALASAMAVNVPSGGMQASPEQPADGSTPPSMPSDGSAAPAMPQGGPTALLSDTLDGLVSDGTITADQQTAIEEALASAMPAPAGEPPSGGTQPPSGASSSGGSSGQSS